MPGSPSIVELLERLALVEAALAEANARIAALETENAELRAENAELRRRLGQNSQNSSRPPSSDSPFDKPAPRSLRGKGGRKAGGQQGHPGSTLAQVADPDEVVRHEPTWCGGCGALALTTTDPHPSQARAAALTHLAPGLAGAARVDVQRRQVFDLPSLTVRVTEHQLIARRCGCGETTCADPPPRVAAPVQYGPRITAIVLYLYVGQFLSKKRTAAALAELFGTPVSEGTVAAMTARAADGLSEFCDVVRGRIAEAPVAGFDETGLRVAGALHWVHCARTDKYTLITCHPNRGRQGIDAAGVLGRFSGVAVHDAWAPYDTYLDAAHQLCCAHALRELAGVAETAPAGAGWCWATQAAEALVTMQRLVAESTAAGADTVDPDALAEQIHRYRSAAQIGATQTAARGDAAMKKQHALARRLLDRQADYLRFTTDRRVPADNNGSERDIRMIKLRQKVSGCLRTLAGAEQFCAIRSYLSTAAKHAKRLIEPLVTLAEGRPWLPAIQ